MTNRTDTPWTPERTALLRKLKAGGNSFGVMAASLGVTRCQVAGKCKREGLVGGSTITLAPVARVRTKQVPIDMLNIGIADLRRNTCRFMASGVTYCGHDTAGGSYCDYHRTIVYRPERRTERRAA